ncbi:hypothetical protein XI09_09170 [Bradyrhizobium sp. CCBAU 11386]|nr:hypothetical protein [Bradyrhizobium sp. CCBAU 11386]
MRIDCKTSEAPGYDGVIGWKGFRTGRDNTNNLICDHGPEVNCARMVIDFSYGGRSYLVRTQEFMTHFHNVAKRDLLNHRSSKDRSPKNLVRWEISLQPY